MKKGGALTIERKVLYELDINSRQTAAQIAKKTQVPLKRVQERIAEFSDTGRIVNYAAVIDYKKIGQYTFYVCNLRIINMNAVREEKTLKKIAMMPESTLVFRCLGAWDIMIGTVAQDIFEAKENFNKMLELFGDKIEKRMIVTHMGAYHYGRRYLLESVEDSEKFEAPMLRSDLEPYAITGGRNSNASIDRTDEKLLRIISTNARMPSIELAKAMKIQPEEVGKRLKVLIAKKVIKYFTIVVNPDKDDYKFYRVYVKLKNATYADQLKIVEQMRKYANVYRVMEIFEEYGFAIDIIAAKDEHMKKILSSLKEYDTDKIVYYDICNIYKVYKNAYYTTDLFKPNWKK